MKFRVTETLPAVQTWTVLIEANSQEEAVHKYLNSEYDEDQREYTCESDENADGEIEADLVD